MTWTVSSEDEGTGEDAIRMALIVLRRVASVRDVAGIGVLRSRTRTGGLGSAMLPPVHGSRLPAAGSRAAGPQGPCTLRPSLWPSHAERRRRSGEGGAGEEGGIKRRRRTGRPPAATPLRIRVRDAEILEARRAARACGVGWVQDRSGGEGIGG
jgi:hypothetical protein